MFRFIKALALLSSFVLLTQGTAFAEPVGGQGAEAEQALQRYKSSVRPQDFNFSDQAALDQATVGDGLPVYMVNLDALLSGPTTLSEALFDTNKVLFPVKSRGETVTLMTMRREGGRLVPDSLGGRGSSFSRGLGLLSGNPVADLRLVRLGGAQFLYLRLQNQELVVYINDYPLKQIKGHQVYTAKNVIPLMQEVARDMKANPDKTGGMGTGAVVTNSTADKTGGTGTGAVVTNSTVGATMSIVFGVVVACVVGVTVWIRRRALLGQTRR